MENKKRLLIVVDAQHDFVDGTLANEEAKKVIPLLAGWLSCVDSNIYDKVYFTRDTHDYNYLDSTEGKLLPVEHCIAGTPGWCVMEDIINAVRTNYKFNGRFPTAVYVDKPTFGYKDWQNKFIIHNDADVTDITLVGFCTDICVISNALILKALYPDANIKVLSEFCAGLTSEKHKAALDVMQSCQIEVI